MRNYYCDLACLCFIKGFNVWTTIRSAAFSFFGIGLYLLVAQLLAVGIIMGLHKLKRSVLVTNICGFLFNATFTGLIHLFTVKISEGNMAEWKEQLSQCAKSAWEIGQGTFSLGGGIEGALFGGTLLHIFGKSGGVIFAVVIFAVSLFFFLNIDLEAFGGKVSEFITNGKSRMDDSAEQMKEKRILRQQEREERLLALQAEREQQEREEAEKRAKQQAQATADSADFDFNSTEVDNDVDTFVDNETGIPLRKIKKYYPEERIFSMGSETATQQTTSKKAVSLSDMDFISERAPQTRTTRKQAAVPSDSISEGTVVRRNIEPVEPQVVTEPEFVFDEEVSEAATDEAQQQVSFSEIAQRASAQAESAMEKSMHDVATQPKQKKKQKKYTLPPLDCLNAPEFTSGESFSQEMQTTAKKLVDILKSFSVETILVGISRGPTVTRYELAPAPGVKINKITNLEDDIALGLASTVRIEAPIPNKAAVGIEVPNKTKSMVTLREIISSEEYQKNKGKFLNVALGKDLAGNAYCADLAPMPHLLIAGTTGSGKSVCLNCMIASILYNATPEQVRLLMIDPKQVEFTVYNGIPHLLVPVITDARKAAGSLAWAVSEMDKRYKAFSNCGVRDIKSFNKYVEKHPELESMPQIVIFIDELNDLMMVSPKEVEDSICRLAQKARAAGIHLVVATQRPSVDVITGTIKANIPARLSLAVSSYVDSKTILDQAGAENLLGHGDMLFSSGDTPKPVRIQGAYLSDEEIEKIVTFIKEQETTEYDSDVMEQIESNATSEKKKCDDGTEAKGDKFDVLLDDAIDLIIASGTASTTAIQRKLSIGFSRAGRIMDQLEALGYVSPADGNKPRTVLISRAQYLESKAGSPPASDGDEDPDNYDIFSD